MSFGKRRSKSIRAQLRPTVPLSPAASPGHLKVRLAIVAASVLATAALVHGAGPPFPFRLGQVPTRDVRVNVDQFQRPNPIKTSTLRQSKADEVGPYLVNDPAPIRDLAKGLEDLIDAVARAPASLAVDEALAEGLAAQWKLDQAAHDTIRTATDTPERRDELHRKVALAFVPVVRDGVLGPNALPKIEETGRPLNVYEAGQTADEAHPVDRDRVLPERLVKHDGPVARDFLAEFSPPELGRTLFGLVAERLAGTPTLRYDDIATEKARQRARDAVPEFLEEYRRGDLLVKQGAPITEDLLPLLRLEHETASQQRPWVDRVRRAGAIVVLVLALFALVGHHVYRHEVPIARELGPIASLCGLVVVTMAAVRLLGNQPWDAELIPVALAAMILAIAYNPHFSLMVTFAICLLTTLSMGMGIGHFIVLMGGTAAGVLWLDQVRTRTKPIQVGAVAALAYGLLTWATGLWQDQPTRLVTTDSAWRAGWGLMTGFLLGGCLPFIESRFGIVTGISLLELGDVTHPLLQELIRRAPGTYNHSIAVGTIAEAAAERIGANGLLVRIGAYYHDIGKMLKPHYFVENQTNGEDRHANLAPAMSTLIIIGHVKDGVDLARQHHLPEPIIDLIEQHHGTTLVEYFYREATRRCGPEGAPVPESSFRYPGPKPRTREAAVLMVADAVESASRTLSEPTPARIEGLVRSIVVKRVDDGQFDECGLTLREIAEVRESLIKSLIGIYHGRVKYPEARAGQRTA
jgi:putative nucleotidyltransferase with HDIG domain